jgi:hypothetical protein
VLPQHFERQRPRETVGRVGSTQAAFLDDPPDGLESAANGIGQVRIRTVKNFNRAGMASQ